MKRFVTFLFPALLLVCQGRAVDLPVAVDEEALTWTTGGDAMWFGQTVNTYDGVDAAQGGDALEGEQSWLQTTVPGPTTVSFWWMSQAYNVSGSFRFYIDGVERAEVDVGYTSWEQKRFVLPAGPHTLRWVSQTDAIWSTDEWYKDCVVDQVVIGLPVIIREPQDVVLLSGEQATLNVSAAGETPLVYQWWQGNSEDTLGPVADATNRMYTTPTVTADVFVGVLVANAQGEAYSRIARVRIGFEIRTLADLQKIGSGVDGWTTDAAYLLMDDIDASETAIWNDAWTDESVLEGFFPIGTVGDMSESLFTGVIDGKGHVIRGLTINRPTQDCVGLFGYVGDGAVIQNLGLIGGSVAGYENVGGLAGYAAGRVTQCYATGEVDGRAAVGGLIGYNRYGSAASQCYATGAVSGDDDIGGLAGYNQGEIDQSYAASVVKGEGQVGGLVGYNADWDGATVTGSYWDTALSGQNDSDGGEAKDSAQMRQQATFEGWDFDDVWGIQEGDGAPYFRLFADGQTDHTTAPTTVCPANFAFVWPLRPVMTAAVDVLDCDIVNARWQIATAPDCSDARDWTGVGSYSGDLRPLVSSRVPVAAALEYDTVYYWRVRAQTWYGMWSDWSAPAQFLVREPFDKVDAGRDELGVWVDGLLAGAWKPDYLFGAHDDFTAAIQSEGTNFEARIYRSVTAIMKLAEDQELRGLLADFGYTLDESLMTFTGTFAEAASPLPNTAVDRIAAQALPVMDAVMADLAVIPTNWPGTVEIAPADFPVDEPVYLDIGDVLYARATFGAARALLETAQAYDLTMDYGKTNLFLPEPAAPALEVTLDGGESEWTNVPAALFGERCQLEYAKIARSATRIHAVARLAEGVQATYFGAEIGSPSNTLSVSFYDLEEGQTYLDGSTTLIYRGNVLELSLDIPPADQGAAFHLDNVRVNYQNPLPEAAPTLAVTEDGDASEWSDVPVALSGMRDRIDFAKIARSNNQIHVLASLKDGVTFDGLSSFWFCVWSSSGRWLYLDMGSATFTCEGAVLEASYTIPSENLADSFYLRETDVAWWMEEGYDLWDWVAFQEYGHDGASYERRSVPLNQILADHPACLSSVRNPGKLATARSSLDEALTLALAADAAAAERTDGLMHFVEYDPANTNAQSELRQRLQEARASMAAAQQVDLQGRQVNVCLGAFFETPYLTRAFLPRLTDADELVSGTFPDPTFKGIFPDMTQAAWQDELLGAVPLVVESAFAMDGQTFTTGGYALWRMMPDAAGCTNVAQSGVMPNESPTWVETSFAGPGTLTFSWAVSSKDKWNFLSVYVDGVRQTGSLSGEPGWSPRQIELTAGSHTVRWAYVKNDCAADGMDAGMLDSLSWTAGTSPATATPVPVPYAWLDGFAGLVQGGAYAAAALADQDSDGHVTWEEYAAGTDPTNAASVFLATITSAGPRLVVGWTPDLGPARVYAVEGKPALTGSAWTPTNASSRFFRVKVQLP